MTQQNHIDALRRANEQRLTQRNSVMDAPSRQHYHFMAEQGWMNDPNGLVFFRGQYHFFYQYNPYGTFWDAMHWGHAVSKDLLHWQYLPVALAPSEIYDAHPKGGCFSGSAIEHEGKLYLLYTGCVDQGHGSVQTQCLAVSEDGIHFDKVSNNPVITVPPTYNCHSFRDPKLLRHDGKFYAVCGHGDGKRGRALLFVSDDLYRWKFVNVLAESRGEWGEMWECPDFFPLGDHYVLTVSPMCAGDRKATYWVGDMDWQRGIFTPVNNGELDWGFDFYAAQSFTDDKSRRLVVAWANEWQWMPWFKGWGPTWRDGWCGFFNVPREVRLNADRTLSMLPAKEMEALRVPTATVMSNVPQNGTVCFATPDSASFEVDACVDMRQTTAQKVVFHLRADGEHETLVELDLNASLIRMNRENADEYSEGELCCPLPMVQANCLPVRILSDVCSVEVFAMDGRVCMSGNVYPKASQCHHGVEAVGGIIVWQRFSVWGMQNAMQRETKP